MIEPTLLVIHWESTVTGAQGHGEPIPAQTALEEVERLNRKYPMIRHFTKEVTEAAKAASCRTAQRRQSCQ